jgi:hypothetical protein
MTSSPRSRVVAAATLLALAAAAPQAGADDRRFVFMDEARVTPPGGREFEQWITWQHETKDHNDFNLFQFKEELELGINPHMQVGLEIPNWHFQTGPAGERQGPRFDTIGADIRYIFLDPTKDSIGLAVKPEIEFSDKDFEIAGRLTLQKNFDKTELVYNATIEAAWEDDGVSEFRERNGEFSEALGASFEVSQGTFVGVELLHEIPMPNWKTGEENQNVFVGPNFSSHHTNWAFTIAPLFRVTPSDEEPRFQVRMILEVDF